MSPSNIARMAAIKGLDIIAVADHNSAANLSAIKQNTDECDILLIPAIEANTKEEVHVLCYFPDLNSCLNYSDYLYSLLPDIPCDPNFFGEQLIYDADDAVVGRLEKLLIGSLPITVEELFDDISCLNGVPVFAHIDRKVNSVISSLGFFPPHLDIQTVEISLLSSPDILQKLSKNPLRCLISSDAHSLSDINERVFALTMEERSISCFLNCLKQK